MATDEKTQRQLKKFLERRHPEYKEMLPHWEFLEDCYEGGREWFEKNIFRYIKEGDKEFKDRIARAYRFNHTREVVDLVDKHLFKQVVSRSDDAPEPVKRFWKSATLNKLKIDDYSRRISNQTSIYGRVWIVVDNGISHTVTSLAEEERSGASTYSYIVTPEHALDMSKDDRGELNWILIHEQIRDDEDPITSSGAEIDRYRLWTRKDWTLFTINKSGKKITVEVEGPNPHDLGVVPVFAADNIVSDEQYCAPSLIDDVAYLDRAVSNYLSNLDAIIQDQTFSQLAMPAQGLLPGEDNYQKLIDMGTKRVFLYDGEGGVPFYLSPDVKQAELILAVVHKVINEIYHTVGLAGERTKDDNSQGIDNSSGVAKAYDFERVNSLLAAKASSLEVIENRIAWFVAKWNGIDLKDEAPVSYPNDFDVRGLYDEFEIAARLSLIEAPELLRRTQMESVIDKLYPRLTKDLRAKMIAELKDWPPKIEDLMGAPAKPGAPNPIKKEGDNSLANSLVKSGSK